MKVLTEKRTTKKKGVLRCVTFQCCKLLIAPLLIATFAFGAYLIATNSNVLLPTSLYTFNAATESFLPWQCFLRQDSKVLSDFLSDLCERLKARRRVWLRVLGFIIGAVRIVQKMMSVVNVDRHKSRRWSWTLISQSRDPNE